MEQGNWNVDEMLHWLDMKINREDRNIREQSKKMNENFLHFFEWNAESLYKSHFMSGCYKILRQAVDGAKGMDTVWNIVEDNIAYCENKLLNGQVDCNSSSRTTNVAHLLKLECMQQLVGITGNSRISLRKRLPKRICNRRLIKQKRREKSRLKER